MSITDTEREADLQAALSRAANHRLQPGDWWKLGPARAGVWQVIPGEKYTQGGVVGAATVTARTAQDVTVAPQNAPGATQTPGQVPDSLETVQDATGADS